MPFIGASALAMATIRPGTRGRVGGTEAVVHAERDDLDPLGVHAEVADMSRLEASDGVMMRRAFLATFACIRRKPYQRLSVSLRQGLLVAARSMRRSRVIGWWIVVTSGRPILSISSMP